MIALKNFYMDAVIWLWYWKVPSVIDFMADVGFILCVPFAVYFFVKGGK
jgi:hypothetical protein